MDLSHEWHQVDLRGGGRGGRGVGLNCKCVCTKHESEFLIGQAEQLQPSSLVVVTNGCTI